MKLLVPLKFTSSVNFKQWCLIGWFFVRHHVPGESGEEGAG